MSVSNCCISQGSVATYLRCGGNYYTRFVGNFFLFTAVQEFLRSVKIWQSYPQSSGPQFFWDTVLVLFLRYSGSNNGMTLKSGIWAVQSRWKWHRSIDHIRLRLLLVCHFKYSSILYYFRVKWSWIILWL